MARCLVGAESSNDTRCVLLFAILLVFCRWSFLDSISDVRDHF